jgi:hypothetical protein
VSEEDIRRHVVFVNDHEGRIGRMLDVPPEEIALHAGVIDREARLVYLARDPIDEGELFAVLEAELAKLEPQP